MPLGAIVTDRITLYKRARFRRVPPSASTYGVQRMRFFFTLLDCSWFTRLSIEKPRRNKNTGNLLKEQKFGSHQLEAKQISGHYWSCVFLGVVKWRRRKEREKKTQPQIPAFNFVFSFPRNLNGSNVYLPLGRPSTVRECRRLYDSSRRFGSERESSMNCDSLERPSKQRGG